ncbi:2964_t:CDS:2 [Entrophospora sp. SA101]|nr:2964_t:CDS:2 [Entrophospora sp. SA101]
MNYGKHLTVHKNRDYIKENQDYMEIDFSSEKSDMSQDGDLNKDEFSKENELNEEYDELSEEDMNDINNISEEGMIYKSTNPILVQKYGPEHEKYHQIPYNLISEECYDFVQLVNAILKYIKKYAPHLNLPSSTSAAIKQFDKSEKNESKFKKEKITIKGKSYDFYYQDIFSAVEGILERQEILEECHWDYENNYVDNEKIYGEQYECNWWKDATMQLPKNTSLLSIIIYSDATTCDKLGKKNLHPIYITLGNLPYRIRNSLNAKSLLGYLPIVENIPDESGLEFSTNQLKELYSEIKRSCFQHCMNILFEPLLDQYKTGISVKLGNGNNKKVTIKLSCIISDLPEASSYCSTFKSYNCNKPCYNCLVPQDQLNNIEDEYLIRTNENMEQAISEKREKFYSVHSMRNIFWDHCDNIYEACIVDRMHQLDLGLFKRMIDYTEEMFIHDSNKHLIDYRLSIIPKFKGLKIFNKGLFGITSLTAKEYRELMKVMPFVLFGIGPEELVENFVNFNKMYILSKSDYFTEDKIKLFEVSMGSFLGPSKKNVETKGIKLFNKYIEIDYKKIDKLLFSKYCEDSYYKLGFENLKENLKNFLDELQIKRNQMEKIIFYKSAYVSNEIIRTNSDYHGASYFSDVEIFISDEQAEQYSSEDGLWYGKIRFEESNIENLQLVMIQWYDYVDITIKKKIKTENTITDKRHKLGCPYMKLAVVPTTI